jgi:hypothetical protein
MEENKLNYKKDETIYLPSNEGCYSIRKFDWNRIKRKVIYTGEKKEVDFKLWYSILYGVGASAGLSIIPIAYTNDLPSWTKPLYIIVALFSILIAIVFTIMNSRFKNNKMVDLIEIKNEMEEVEKLFEQKNEK